MMYARTLAMCSVVGIVCSAHALEGQGLSNYRNFELQAAVTARRILDAKTEGGPALLALPNPKMGAAAHL